MPQSRPNVLTTRVTNAGFAAVEKLAIKFGVSRMAVVREMMAVAMAHPAEIEARLKASKPSI